VKAAKRIGIFSRHAMSVKRTSPAIDTPGEIAIGTGRFAQTVFDVSHREHAGIIFSPAWTSGKDERRARKHADRMSNDNRLSEFATAEAKDMSTTTRAGCA
jgi:hypothetical protein